MWNKLCYIYLLAEVLLVSADNPCNLRETEGGSVCVCNSTYCDTVPNIAVLASGGYQWYSSSKAKLGFYSTTGTFSNSSNIALVTVTVSDLNSRHQSIIGFGGAFTDAVGINIGRLPELAQDLLLRSYFGNDGIEYSLGRVPIGGTDFSTRPYTYADEKDETLQTFALQNEDQNFKIPYIIKALNLRGEQPYKLFASAWTAPIWMKTNSEYNGLGTLKDEYWQLWADYYIKFFEAYYENGISFWGVTTQNEPLNGNIGSVIPNIGFTPTQMVSWVSQYLGPAIRNSTYSNLKIILHDDQRYLLPTLQLLVLSNPEVIQYADGVGVHWYGDSYTPALVLDSSKNDKEGWFRLATEACTGFNAITGLEEAVVLGSWDRAEQYLSSIFDDLKYDVGGWTDWNMALNESGGPTWINNQVDSPIIVNGTSGEFYKQPMFYALGHFSKFVVPGSIRINVDVSLSLDIVSVAFIRPDGKIVVVLENKSSITVSVKVNILGSTQIFAIEKHSINTILYSNL